MSVNQSKSFESTAETDMLMASTDTLAARRMGFHEELKRDVWKFFRNIWNPDSEEVLRRSESTWAKVLLFHLTVFSGLAALTAIGFALYLQVYIDKNHPRTQGKDTLLLGWPSLGFRPMPDYRTTLIRFEQGKPASYKPYSDHIRGYLLHYENEFQESESFIDCEVKNQEGRDKSKVCRFLLDKLGPECVHQRDYGYDEGQPCVLLKLNKIFNWEPLLYNGSDVPRELAGGKYDLNYVGVTCEGENPIDQENIGPLKYWPEEQGFLRDFYPYRNQEGYKAPLVMVKFAKVTNGIVINVWCKAWARNIQHHRYDDMGGVHFELLVD